MPLKDRKGDPQGLAVEILKRVYLDLETKDMSEDKFVKESLGALRNSKKKNSPLILPN